MRDLFSYEILRFLAYKRDQNRIRSAYYNIFPDRYVENINKVSQIMFELSSRCNLKCPFCTNRLKDSGSHMSYEKAVEYFNKLPKSIKSFQLHFSGESFLNPEIERITEFLSNQGLFLSVSTNGTLPPQRYINTLEKGLDQLIFAIDGATPETHQKYRVGSDFNKIMRTLEKVIQKKPPTARVGVQYLVTRYNENEFEKMRSLLREMSADFLHLKTLSLDIAANETLDKDKLRNAIEFLPENGKYSRYRYKNNQLKLRYPIILCPFIFEPVIGADGEISLCCIDLERKTKIGNLNDCSSFEELWNLEAYRTIRKKAKSKKLPVCKKCNLCLVGLKKSNL